MRRTDRLATTQGTNLCCQLETTQSNRSRSHELCRAVISIKHLAQIVCVGHKTQLYQHSPHAHILLEKALPRI